MAQSIHVLGEIQSIYILHDYHETPPFFESFDIVDDVRMVEAAQNFNFVAIFVVVLVVLNLNDFDCILIVVFASKVDFSKGSRSDFFD